MLRIGSLPAKASGVSCRRHHPEASPKLGSSPFSVHSVKQDLAACFVVSGAFRLRPDYALLTRPSPPG